MNKKYIKVDKNNISKMLVKDWIFFIGNKRVSKTLAVEAVELNSQAIRGVKK